jgi:hypothetical protein
MKSGGVPILVDVISFTYLVFLARISGTMLNTSGENKHSQSYSQSEGGSNVSP